MSQIPAEHEPNGLDALQAAPLHHMLLYENDAVRVLETNVPAGQTVPLHTHRWPALLYILKWSHFVRRDHENNVVADSRASVKPLEGTALYAPPLPPHTLENVGDSDLRILSIEMKTAN